MKITTFEVSSAFEKFFITFCIRRKSSKIDSWREPVTFPKETKKIWKRRQVMRKQSQSDLHLQEEHRKVNQIAFVLKSPIDRLSQLFVRNHWELLTPLNQFRNLTVTQTFKIHHFIQSKLRYFPKFYNFLLPFKDFPWIYPNQTTTTICVNFVIS